MTVGIDGGMVRARHKAGCFEVIAGTSIVAFRRNQEQDILSCKLRHEPPASAVGADESQTEQPVPVSRRRRPAG